MIRYWIAYLLLVGFGVFFYIIFVGYFSYYFLCLILVLPIISLLYLIGVWKFTKVEFRILNERVIQGDRVEIEVVKDCFGLGALKFIIDDKKYLLKGNQDKLDLVFKHCGGKNFTVEHYYQYDCLNLFRIKKKCFYQIPITIYPEKMELDYEDYLRYLPSDGEVSYAANQKGDDPTEIYDIHKYQDGDLLKNIHWKLTARLQEVLVKDNALLVSEVVNIHVLFSDNDDHNDLTFSYLDAFCLMLLKHEIDFMLSSKVIKSKQEYDDVFKYLLWNKENQGNISKKKYEFVISEKGITWIEGGQR